MAHFFPLFPLSTVVFPGEGLNLHIFEPRYRKLVADCLAGQGTFGIPPYIEDKVGTIATEMEIVDVSRKYPDGRMDIRTRGLNLIEIIDFQNPAEGKPYAAGQGHRLESNPTSSPDVHQQLAQLVLRLFGLLGIAPSTMDMDAETLSYAVGHHVGLSLGQEYELLCTPTEQERQHMLIEHLETTIPLMDELERTKARVRMNGHFKHFDPLNF